LLKNEKEVYNFYDFLLIDDLTIDDCKIWLSNNENNNNSLNYEIAKSIFLNTYKQFLEMIDYEEAIKNEHESDDDSDSKHY
jgi:hypothetical protein